MRRGLVAARRRARRMLTTAERVAVLYSTDAAAERVDDLRDALGGEPERWHRDRLAAGEIRRRLAAGIDLLACEGEPGDDIARAAAAAGVRVADLAELYAACTGRLPLPLVEPGWIRRRAMEAGKRPRWRRALDGVASAALLAVSAPVQLLIAVTIAADAGTPVLFRQRRLGHLERSFTLFKFRTMVLGAEDGGARWAEPSDPRATRLGRHLRRHHLDELPQLLNVLAGDLSLIGPRPIRARFARRLAERQPLYPLRFCHPAGLTGWSQVIGPYGRTVDEHLVKLEMDLLYLTCGNRLDDLYILWKTAAAAACGRGL